jgi:hypothetical protein
MDQSPAGHVAANRPDVGNVGPDLQDVRLGLVVVELGEGSGTLIVGPRSFDRELGGYDGSMRRRTGEKIFGVLAILVGVGVIAAIASGIELPRVVLPAMTLVMIGWGIYHHVVIRPSPYGVKRPEDSPPHDPD